MKTFSTYQCFFTAALHKMHLQDNFDQTCPFVTVHCIQFAGAWLYSLGSVNFILDGLVSKLFHSLKGKSCKAKIKRVRNVSDITFLLLRIPYFTFI